MGSPRPGITFKAKCERAKEFTLIFTAGKEEVAYFKPGVEYAVHATALPADGDKPSAPASEKKKST